MTTAKKGINHGLELSHMTSGPEMWTSHHLSDIYIAYSWIWLSEEQYWAWPTSDLIENKAAIDSMRHRRDTERRRDYNWFTILPEQFVVAAVFELTAHWIGPSIMSRNEKKTEKEKEKVGEQLKKKRTRMLEVFSAPRHFHINSLMRSSRPDATDYFLICLEEPRWGRSAHLKLCSSPKSFGLSHNRNPHRWSFNSSQMMEGDSFGSLL